MKSFLKICRVGWNCSFRTQRCCTLRITEIRRKNYAVLLIFRTGQLILILEEEVEAGYLSETNRNTIISLLGKSMIRVFYRNEAMLKEVVDMTEPILELEFEKYEKVIAEQARVLEEKDKTLSEKEARIQELERKLAKMERRKI